MVKLWSGKNWVFFCGKCGKRLGTYKPKEYIFCPYCGVKIRE